MKLLRVALLFLYISISALEASAIIMRHDRPDSSYIVSKGKYRALTPLLDINDCMATLIHRSFLLTVAHCAHEFEAGSSLKLNGIQRIVSKVILHPKWRDENDEFDIALLRLQDPVNDVSPLPLYRGADEKGRVLTLLGMGVHGTGIKGEPGAKGDDKLRRAKNTITEVNRYFLEIVFERPGEKGVLELEGVGAAGDSGGPGFIEEGGVLKIAGINAWGEGRGKTQVGQYGARDYQTRISKYLSWLDGVIGASTSVNFPKNRSR